MPSKAPDDPGTIRASAQRVAAPPTQTRTKRLPPAYALAWLHLLPNSEFPIRSRDDMAVKISALLFRPRRRRMGPFTRSRRERSRNRAGNAPRADVDRRRREQWASGFRTATRT